MRNIIETLKSELKEINSRLLELYAMEPIFGIISVKYIKCGKKNCKCNNNSKYKHGPYFYLRQEPDYKYTRYLGKRIPDDIKRRIETGNAIKKLEKKKKQIRELLEKMDHNLIIS